MKVALSVWTLLAADAAQTKLSPVTRVVELLKGISESVESEVKKEEDLYESFVCWGNAVINAKTASNAAATSRIDSLTQYIADLDAGRIELTSERKDLEKQIEEINADLEAAETLRQQENTEFQAAEEEMNQAIEALDGAINVLKDATTGQEEGELVQFEQKMAEGFAERSRQSEALLRAIDFGKRFLSAGDSIFLQRLLTGDVPKADWKKLNRKAGFKMAYKARSFKIQDVLKKLQSTFTANLQEATDKEADAKTAYDNLTGSKKEELSQAQDALTDMDSENGAKGLSKSDASDEIDALTTQRTNDEAFLEQTNSDLTLKKQEWKDRKMLRMGEIAAIGKAISILHSDDNRDLLKKSLASQSFLQLRKSENFGARAAAALRVAGQSTNDKRLIAMAAGLEGLTGHFDEVITSIDEMITLLKTQTEEDLTTKEQCESDRMADSRDAIMASRDIDEMSDKKIKLTEEIAEIASEIKDKQDEILAITAEDAEAARLRQQDTEDWVRSNSDDERAAQVVQSAKEVLENFYSENNLNLVQKGKKQPAVTAGEAPPPPPSTWDTPYSGKQQETGSVVQILTVIKEDIEKDMAKAKTEEDEAATEFNTQHTAFETQRDGLNDDIATLEGTSGSKTEEIQTTKENRKTRKQELDNYMSKMSDASVGCDYITVNFDNRKKNRDTELDGLLKAKAILEGGAFPELLDTKHDAFLKKARRHH